MRVLNVSNSRNEYVKFFKTCWIYQGKIKFVYLIQNYL